MSAEGAGTPNQNAAGGNADSVRRLLTAWDALGIHGAANAGRSQTLIVPRAWGADQRVEAERTAWEDFMRAVRDARSTVHNDGSGVSR